ncbi:pua rna binding domain-containing protein [Fusarium denticulatum]|uniref:Pua rna binding domain-containing protein n=1 Tax=Fusarium denticulatum TaxID=48507 RepID=A0A8H5SY28_9HYPO|nr:pua rna binding domain-containing protein [Fusarium denticulatum]
MPLVVPGINSTSGDKAEEWQNKLIGKKLSDEETSTENVFAKRDLPQETRIIEPGMMVTKDFKEDRLNVHLKDDGTVSHVVKG